MNNSELTIGREAVAKMLHYIYRVAFDAHAEITNTIVTNSKAVLEANFVGKHIGEFAGFQATGKNVKVPLCNLRLRGKWPYKSSSHLHARKCNDAPISKLMELRS